MEPRALEDPDLALLPEHMVVVFAKDQPQYRPLPAAVLTGREGRVITRWTFTDDERKAIAEGADIFLAQLTFASRLQPVKMALDVLDVVPCPADRELSGVEASHAVSAAFDAAHTKMQ